jgi:hypothetical protein
MLDRVMYTALPSIRLGARNLARQRRSYDVVAH